VTSDTTLNTANNAKSTEKTKFLSLVWNLSRTRQITASGHKVLETLASYIQPGAMCFPSHEEIAFKAGASRSTVIRALRNACELGIITTQKRMKRVGSYLIRTSNSYAFILDQVEQARMSAKALYEQAKKAAENRRSNYIHNLSVKMNPDQSNHLYYTADGTRQRHASKDSYLELIASWAAEWSPKGTEGIAQGA